MKPITYKTEDIPVVEFVSYVDFAGTFITDKPIVFPNPDDHYIPLREE